MTGGGAASRRLRTVELLHCGRLTTETKSSVSPTARGWTDSPTIVGDHILPLTVGGPSEGHWLLDLFSTRPIPRQGDWLSLHCGAGGLELLATQRGLFASLEGYDPSPAAIADARAWVELHAVPGVRFEVGAVPDLELRRASFDLVLSQYSLHRVRELDSFLARIEAALKPGGWLVCNEYIGPRRFQFGAREMGIVEELLHCLPHDLKTHWPSGLTKHVHIPPPAAHFEEHAPLEAVSSEEIVPAITARFDVDGVRGYGGAILSPLLEGILGNFDESKESDRTILRLLAVAERLLMREAALPSNFAVIVAKKR
jgi:SAM-dependent methyltransferase